MDFEWSSAHRAFRGRVRDFIAANLPSDWEEKSKLDVSCDYTTKFSLIFCPALAEAGLLVPHWPSAYGGQDLDPWHHWILNEEMFWAGEPRGYQYMSVNWAGPALIRFGSDDQKARILPKIAGGRFFFCQGFSEPQAGSDLASLRSTATPTSNGEFRLNGQKIWTSAASFAEYCVVLARTGENSRGGISVFLMPMDRPGITVRVIPGLQGERSFHEVFFDDVHLYRTDLLGEENRGWEVITQILHNERIGIPRYMLALRALDKAADWLSERGRLDDSAMIAAANARLRCDVARLQCYKVIDDRVKGAPPSAETGLARTALVDADRTVGEFIADFLMDSVGSNGDPVISACYKRTASTGIASGTREMQLNMIAKDHLQLPRYK